MFSGGARGANAAIAGILAALIATACSPDPSNSGGQASLKDESPVGEAPVITTHLEQADIVSGEYSFAELFARGQLLFDAKFNKLDGQGRPATTGAGDPRDSGNDPGFLRTSGTDAGACASCHNEPRSGGAGDFVANVFVLAQARDPVTFDVREANERNTLGMFGGGAIELLGREMSDDLLGIRAAALREAETLGAPVTRELLTKTVSFGEVTAFPDGSFDNSAVEGVDTDLVIKPFHQKGVVRSLREFTVNAMNHHHGMQPVERFGIDRTGTDDFDQDGVADELTVGDITAATIFQAALATPAMVAPATSEKLQAVVAGRALFGEAGCDSCHVPSLTLENPVFCEPYARNPPGTFNDTAQAYCFDLTRQGQLPLLSRRNGIVEVRAFTDLKRHVICDAEKPHFCNENLVQAGVPTDQFLTRKLWDAGNSAPYGHRGDLTTLTEAILNHGGEGAEAREAFESLSETEQARIIEFLKSLKVTESTRVVDR